MPRSRTAIRVLILLAILLCSPAPGLAAAGRWSVAAGPALATVPGTQVDDGIGAFLDVGFRLSHEVQMGVTGMVSRHQLGDSSRLLLAAGLSGTYVVDIAPVVPYIKASALLVSTRDPGAAFRHHPAFAVGVGARVPIARHFRFGVEALYHFFPDTGEPLPLALTFACSVAVLF